MGIGPGTNPWWQDVLQNGRASEHADFFDIDWEPLKEELRDKVLIPILGSTYGDELESGNIKLNFAEGRFCVSYFENVRLVDPQTIPLIFEPLDELAAVTNATGRSGAAGVSPLARRSAAAAAEQFDRSRAGRRRQREIPVLQERLTKLAGRTGGSGRHGGSAAQGQRRRRAILRASTRCTRCWKRKPIGWLLASVGRRDQLPALLRHQRPGRSAHGRSAGLCRDPSLIRKLLAKAWSAACVSIIPTDC